jgi:hypothetical protein
VRPGLCEDPRIRTATSHPDVGVSGGRTFPRLSHSCRGSRTLGRVPGPRPICKTRATNWRLRPTSTRGLWSGEFEPLDRRIRSRCFRGRATHPTPSPALTQPRTSIAEPWPAP